MKKILMFIVAFFLCISTAMAYDPYVGPETVDEGYAETAMFCALVYEGFANSGQFPKDKYFKLAKENVKYAVKIVGKELSIVIYETIEPVVKDKFGPNFENVDVMYIEWSYECQKASTMLPQVIKNQGK